MLTLLVLQGPDKGRRFELPDAPALVGRDSRQLPLTDNSVSRRHCELTPGDDGQWTLRDLNSSNGTYVNGGRVNRLHALKLGDQVRVGRTIMVFGAQPGVSRSSGGNVSLAGAEAGMDSSIMHRLPSSDDSMVLAVPEPAAAAMNNLKTLYRLGAALGSSFNLNDMLEVVMDLVLGQVKADRGIILLLDEKTNELTPKVVRVREENGSGPSSSRDPGALRNGADASRHGAASDGDASRERDPLRERDLTRPAPSLLSPEPEDAPEPEPPPKIQASRTIINHVIATGEGVLSSNAMSDHRFSKGKSVHDLGIRSAMCAPIKASRPDATATAPAAGNGVIGVIYIDSSVRNYTYSPDQLRLLTAIGLQAGLAIQNAILYRQGIEAERLAAIGETTAALSHSVKNILQALRGGADVVEMGLRGNNIAQASKGWRIVDRNLDKIMNLTLNLLSYSKPREPKLEPVNPRQLIDECLELIAASANEKQVMAVADVEEDHPAIPLDQAGMHQVIMNLLSNALDAVEPRKGLIRVECRYDAERRQSTIEVSDNGAGISSSMMKHLFELFHSTKGNRGTGLGLAVAKKIVEEHEGTITAASAPNQGTTFTIRLPVLHETLSDPAHTHGPPQ